MGGLRAETWRRAAEISWEGYSESGFLLQTCAAGWSLKHGVHPDPIGHDAANGTAVARGLAAEHESPDMTRSSEFQLPLAVLRQRVAASNLLPATYARYRPLLAEALCFFLQRLSLARLRRIFAEQMCLPSSAPTAERVVALMRHSPVLHKLGQVVARDRRLEVGFRASLRKLESLEPRTPPAVVMRLLARELGDWEGAAVELGPAAIAEGSVAVIMPFVWHGEQTPRHGVFKLLKPGIERLLEEDLKVLSRLGDFLEEHCERFHLPALDYRDTFDRIRGLLLREVRLELEQRHLAEAAAVFSSTTSLRIPALLPFCSARLTAMERIYGEKVADGLLPERVSRQAAARTVADALVAQPLFSTRPAALFHGDPHAGNLLITPDGQVAILDWSLAGHLSKQERIELMQLVLGAVILDPSRMERALQHLAPERAGAAAVRDVLEACLRELSWRRLPDLNWLTRLLDRLVLGAGVRFGSNLLLFRKALLMLEGVLADLTLAGADARSAVLDEAVFGAFGGLWSAEWPARFLAPLNTRSFATHLSTADLWLLLGSAPATFARRWGEAWLGSLQPVSPQSTVPS
jgi:ubiquinone biosynthesis protein